MATCRVFILFLKFTAVFLVTPMSCGDAELDQHPDDAAEHEALPAWSDITDAALRQLEYGLPRGTEDIMQVLPFEVIQEVLGKSWPFYESLVGRECYNQPGAAHVDCVWRHWRVIKRHADAEFYTGYPYSAHRRRNPVTWDHVIVAHFLQLCPVFHVMGGGESAVHVFSPGRDVFDVCPNACASRPCDVAHVDSASPCRPLSYTAGDYVCTCVHPYAYSRKRQRCEIPTDDSDLEDFAGESAARIISFRHSAQGGEQEPEQEEYSDRELVIGYIVFFSIILGTIVITFLSHALALTMRYINRRFRRNRPRRE